jgi:hypothetical protein
MSIPPLSTVALAVLFIAACSADKTPDRPPPAPPAKTVFDPLTQQLQRAKGVQNTVDANTDSTRQSVEHEERGDSPPP